MKKQKEFKRWCAMFRADGINYVVSVKAQNRKVYFKAHGLKPGDWIGCEWPECPRRKHRTVNGAPRRNPAVHSGSIKS
jgi:hypothetical protein